ncbi:MAG: hypothetical protein J6A62_08565 [Oscillospiraceae bacterium]|nr:hypothetical protein [Oscillospiraceae bacterium]
MGITSLFDTLMFDVMQVYFFLQQVFEALPLAIHLLIYAAFGGTALLCIVRGLGR